MWANPLGGRLLLLHGENGTGKTHCARAVRRWVNHVGPSKQFMRRENHVESLSALYWHFPDFVDTLKAGGWDVVEDLFTAPVVILDEIGGEHDPSRIGVDKLCQVLSRREKMWTVITTNILTAHWEEKFDRRIASRFYRNSVTVNLEDVPDYNL